MKKFISFLLVGLLLFLSAYLFFLQKAYLKIKRPLVATAPGLAAAIPQQAGGLSFVAGEKFNFFYSMGPLRAGSAKLTFAGKADIDGQEAFHIIFESKVGTFYDLENIYAETENFYPLLVERKITNFGMTTTIKEKYNQKNFKVEIAKGGLLFNKNTVVEKQKPIHNALLLIYYCRKLLASELKPGFEFDIVLPVDEFKVSLTRIEKIKVPAGKFQAYLFESTPKKIRLWIAKDEKHTPLKMENLTSFGPSSIVLEEY